MNKNMENEFIIKVDENGVTHYVNPAFEDTFDITQIARPNAEEIAEQEAVEKRRQAKVYLAETDWYITRQAETGTPIPEEVLSKRAQARIDANN